MLQSRLPFLHFYFQLTSLVIKKISLLLQITDIHIKQGLSVIFGELSLLDEVPLGLQPYVVLLQDLHLNSHRKRIKNC